MFRESGVDCAIGECVCGGAEDVFDFFLAGLHDGVFGVESEVGDCSESGVSVVVVFLVVVGECESCGLVVGLCVEVFPECVFGHSWSPVMGSMGQNMAIMM